MVTGCFKCAKALVPVFPGWSKRAADKQFNDVLHIELSGGYGEYVDGAVSIMLCKECADELLEQNKILSIAVTQYLRFIV